IETAEKGKSVFKPARDVAAARPIRGQPPRLIQGSEVYLVTNRGERKATGSYYTPKYIVDYIVENTVGPVAEEAAKKVAELRPDVDDKIKKLERARRGWEKSSARDAPEHIAGLNKLIEEQKRRLLEPYLSLKILDPAMGSGHFLVGAADRLSQEMATDPNLIPPGETDSENPQAFYKRLIVERCLYGVDLNPLAVELAKLSLWLHTVSKGKALSFLDHHLRCGNSLIGARIEDDLMKYPPHLDARGKLKRLEEDLVSGVQEALYAGPLAQILELLHKISEIPTQDAATEKMKEGLYAELEKAREKFRAVANCWLAPYFGVRVEFDQYQRAVSALRRSAAEWQAIGDEPWFCAAQAAAQQKHFFHWELEFPEVFFAPHGFKPKDQRGFDVVIGNPPWVSFGLRGVGKLIDDEETFYRERLSESAQYKISMYAMFIERGLSVSKFGGYHGFIVPDSFLLGQYFSDVRRCILSHSFIEGIALILEDFWESGDVGRNVVYILNKQSPETTKSRHIMTVLMAETLQDFGQHKWRAHSYPQMHFEQLHLNRFRLFCSLQQEVFVRRVESAEVVTAGRIMSIHTGVRSKVGQKNVTSKMAKGLSWKKGLTSSASVTRYGVLWDGDYINIVPALLWAGGWDSDVVNQPKILIRQTGDRIIAGIDRDKLYHLNNIHAAVLHDVSIRLGYVLSLLNSKLMFKYYTLISLEFERAMAQTDIETLEQLPIRRIAFTTPKAERERLVEEGKALCERTISAMTQGVK
ncbi:N-6 DNA methylase, partial [Candidatus Sumerlaeota bacterium]|nr:N-6 DNA methylase [Candidatus Sumerlaeota bacterium]